MGVSSTEAPVWTALQTEYITAPTGVQSLAGAVFVPPLAPARQASGVARRGPSSAGGRRGGFGLSTAHKWPHGGRSDAVEGRGELWLGGSLCEFQRPGVKQEQQGGGLRGRCVGFSAGSRRRLQRTFGKIKRDAPALFVTLTYPGEFSQYWKRWKRDLRSLAKRLKRKFPSFSALWRLEPQMRGAPHYHLLVYGVAFIPHEWLAQAWYEIVGSGDERHLWAGTQVQAIQSHGMAGAYVRKYLAKPADGFGSDVDWQHVGRWWGVLYREDVPWAERLCVSLTDGEAKRGMRFLRRYVERQARAKGRQFRLRSGLRSFAALLDVGQVWGALPQLL